MIRGVCHSITEDDVGEELRELNIHWKKIVRIISKATNNPTMLVRVILTDEKAYNHLLTNGIRIYGCVCKCEPSHQSERLSSCPKFCHGCKTTEHSTEECNQMDILCSICGHCHPIDLCTSCEPQSPVGQISSDEEPIFPAIQLPPILSIRDLRLVALTTMTLVKLIDVIKSPNA